MSFFTVKGGNMFRLLYFVLNSVYNIIQYSYISGKIYNKGLFFKDGQNKTHIYALYFEIQERRFFYCHIYVIHYFL